MHCEIHFNQYLVNSNVSISVSQTKILARRIQALLYQLKLCTMSVWDTHLYTLEVEAWISPNKAVAIDMEMLVFKCFQPILLAFDTDVIMFFMT